jgi:hypothetical protein
VEPVAAELEEWKLVILTFIQQDTAVPVVAVAVLALVAVELYMLLQVMVE